MKTLVFETLWGWCGAQLSERGVLAFRLPVESQARAQEILSPAIGAQAFDLAATPGRISAALDNRHAGDLVEQTRAYFEHRLKDFDLALDWSGRTGFHRKIWSALREVAYGETTTYGELAERAGCSRAVRAVGGAMRANPIPLIVPCHRVVGAGGALRGFSAEGGVAVKQRLLEFESTRSAYLEAV